MQVQPVGRRPVLEYPVSTLEYRASTPEYCAGAAGAACRRRPQRAAVLLAAHVDSGRPQPVLASVPREYPVSTLESAPSALWSYVDSRSTRSGCSRVTHGVLFHARWALKGAHGVLYPCSKGTRGVLCGYSHTPVRRQVLLDLLETTDFFIRCGCAWRTYRRIDICSIFVFKVQVPHDPAACVRIEYCNSYIYTLQHHVPRYHTIQLLTALVRTHAAQLQVGPGLSMNSTGPGCK